MVSRDSWLGQRNVHTLSVGRLDGGVDFAVEVFDVVEGHVGKVVGLQVSLQERLAFVSKQSIGVTVGAVS